jgi:hypothetical protein
MRKQSHLQLRPARNPRGAALQNQMSVAGKKENFHADADNLFRAAKSENKKGTGLVATVPFEKRDGRD